MARLRDTPILEPLSAHRDQLTILTGLAHRNADNYGDGTAITARHADVAERMIQRTEGADVQAGTTADQVAANTGEVHPVGLAGNGYGCQLSVGNCENGYSCVYMNTIPWRTIDHPEPG
jgi:hypothetical protein